MNTVLFVNANMGFSENIFLVTLYFSHISKVLTTLIKLPLHYTTNALFPIGNTVTVSV